MIKYRVGSKAVGLVNAKDDDYVALTDDGFSGIINKPRADLFIRDKTELTKTLHFEQEDLSKRAMYLYNYQYDEHFIGKDFPIKYNVLDYKKQYIEFLREVVDREECNLVSGVTFGSGKCSKKIYHIQYILFILRNNSPVLTAEQMAVVQKIHDGNMPIEYVDILKRKILELSI